MTFTIAIPADLAETVARAIESRAEWFRRNKEAT